MKRVCAWCNTLIGIVSQSGEEDSVITHTICPDCADNLDFQLGVPLNRFIDSLPVPVIILDGTAQIIAINRPARDLTGKGQEEATCQPVGNIFECAFARLPGGCGNTVHCSGCAIRRSVLGTFETGEPFENIPAFLRNDSLNPDKKTTMLISTKKLDALVQLSIVWLGPAGD